MSDIAQCKQHLHNLLEGGRWQSTLNFFESSEFSENIELLPYKAQALLRLERMEEAYEILLKILPEKPQNPWIINLFCKAQEFVNGEEGVARFLKEHIEKYSVTHEGTLNRAADLLRSQSQFSEAIAINRRRKAIVTEERKIALAIQTFNKEDTLRGLFESILSCEEAEYFAPVILQDSWIGSSKPEEFEAGHKKVKNVINEYFPKLIDKFGSVEVLVNTENLGTAPSCVKLLNHVSERYKSFVFFEDDCILYKDTLTWSRFAINELLNEFGAHFATCESVFFDYGRNSPPSESQLEKIKTIANKLSDRYCKLKFVPSTNFMTTSRLWKRYSELRRLPRGPESLNQYFADIKGMCIFPLVPRTTDVGMEHDLGFSTTSLGAGNVKEIKNSYINSGMYDVPYKYLENLEHQDLIYSASSKLIEKHIDELFLLLKC